MNKTNWTKEMEEAYQQNLSKLRLELEMNQALEEIRKDSRNEFLKLIDDYTLELLLDYHLGCQSKGENYLKASNILKDEYKFRSDMRNSGNNFS